jgi:hypothetical protein
MPSVVCASCLRRNRVRQKSLGCSVVCTYCAASFVAEESARTSQEPLSYGPDSSGDWQLKFGMILLLAVAVLAVWLLARSY